MVFTDIFLSSKSISQSSIGPSFLFNPNKKISSSASYGSISLVSKFLRVIDSTQSFPIIESIR